jgi:hypothetical protein
MVIRTNGALAFGSMQFPDFQRLCSCFNGVTTAQHASSKTLCPYKQSGHFAALMKHSCSELKLVGDLPLASQVSLRTKTLNLVKSDLAEWDMVSTSRYLFVGSFFPFLQSYHVTIHHIYERTKDKAAISKYDALFPPKFFLTGAPTPGAPTSNPTVAPTVPTAAPTSIDAVDLVPTPEPQSATPQSATPAPKPSLLSDDAAFQNIVDATTALPVPGLKKKDPCEYTAWEEWSDCSAPCISGTQRRTRKWNLATKAPKQCHALTFEIRTCNMGISCGLSISLVHSLPYFSLLSLSLAAPPYRFHTHTPAPNSWHLISWDVQRKHSRDRSMIYSP